MKSLCGVCLLSATAVWILRWPRRGQSVSQSEQGVSAATSGSNYYVSPTGSDSSDGSASSPWATMGHADSIVGPGATVHVAPGVYAASINTYTSGTASARIVYVSDVKWGAKVIGTNDSTWSNWCDYLDMLDFDVTGPCLNCI